MFMVEIKEFVDFLFGSIRIFISTHIFYIYDLLYSMISNGFTKRLLDEIPSFLKGMAFSPPLHLRRWNPQCHLHRSVKDQGGKCLTEVLSYVIVFYVGK